MYERYTFVSRRFRVFDLLFSWKFGKDDVFEVGVFLTSAIYHVRYFESNQLRTLATLRPFEHAGETSLIWKLFLSFVYLLASWLATWSSVLPEKLTVSHLVKFPAFYGTRRFVTAFTTTSHVSQSRAGPVSHASPSHFLEIHFSIMASMRRSSELFSFPQVSPPKSCMHLASSPYVSHAPHIWSFPAWSPE
jgi:hypothetical protein